ncbi:MAG: DUF1800 domain-containing protein [Candidatus Rokubacteria bacterium]|nr:DUF1800 domain-containing protein [Candidatus Rokubacteria bacterium]
MRARALAALALTAAATLGAAPATPDDGAILHALGRLTFGPRPGDVERVRALGLAAWLERQLAPERVGDVAVDRTLGDLTTLAMSIPELLREYPRPDPAMREKMQGGQMTRRELMERYPPEKRPARIAGELAAAKMLRAVASERQLQEVMVDFWFNHFNVYAQKNDVRWYVSAYERDAIRPHALGKFPDLVRATARHPAMLYYLDNWVSARADFTIPLGPNRGKKAGLNENYARELMELHTLGVDGGYTQQDIVEVARAFTGWSIERPQTEGRFVFRRATHDTGAKVVLGQRIPAGGGQEDGERVIETLVRHPSTARFIATKLARRFVADTPPPRLVERVAAAYQATGGDIPGMLRVIFAAPEFWGPEARRAKIKKPFEFVASAVRAVGATVDAQGAYALARASAEIGEPLYEAQPPTGYQDVAEAWVNTGALLARMNFALALTSGRYPRVAMDLPGLVAGADPARPEAVLDRLLAALVHGQAGRDTRAVLAAQLADPQITQLTADDRGPARTDVARLAALVLGSPEFQRR